MRLLGIAILSLLWLPGTYAQERLYDGIVFDGNSQQRIAKVSIVNLNNYNSVFDNLQAEFKIKASPGDLLIFSKIGYFNDTVKVGTELPLIVFLKPTAILLREVKIRSTVLAPDEQLARTKQDYTKVYGHLSDHDLLTVGGNGGGAGLSIDGLYNLLSFSGRNASRLREIIERDYHENVIDYKFNHTLVASVTGLKEPQLSDFMFKYRPGYYFVLQSNEYDLISYIRTSFKRYSRFPDAYALPPLFK